MTPADNPNADANTRRDANFTNLGKNTTEAPNAVAPPAPATNAMAIPTLLLSSTSDMVDEAEQMNGAERSRGTTTDRLNHMYIQIDFPVCFVIAYHDTATGRGIP